MAYNPNKELKLYYSIGEVAKMFDVNNIEKGGNAAMALSSTLRAMTV